MDPIEILRNEHGLIRRFVDLLSVAVTRLEVDQPPPRAFFDDGIEFVRGFSDGFHHKKEELVMFVQLAQKKNGAIDGQIEALKYQHDQGRLAMEKHFAGKVKTTYVENVPEGADAERVIRKLASTGHNVIFTTSFGFMNPTVKVAKQFPKVTFEHATGYKRAKNLGT